MGFETLDESSDSEVMNDINMTPLIDVMLVLLIIFIITIPVINHAATIDLPRVSNAPAPVTTDTVQIGVDAEGSYFWNGQPVSQSTLEVRLRDSALESPQPSVHVQGDRGTRYEKIAWLLSCAQQQGVRTISFVTNPISQ